jgi:integrase
MSWVLDGVPLPKTQKKLPVDLSPAEGTQFFEAIPSLKYRAILMTAHAAGLRVSEVVALRVAVNGDGSVADHWPPSDLSSSHGRSES